MKTKESGLHNSTVYDKIFSINKYDIMTQERWEGIIECKRRFLEDKSYDPRTCPHMNPYVAASWVRCRQMGIDPHQPFLGRRLNSAEFEQVLEKNRLLIEITKPLINTFKHLAISTDYGLYMTDNKGVFLLHEGEVLSSPLYSYPLTGMMWDEKSIGTTAHSLSLLHKRPFRLTGVENFNENIENTIASSAPILDEDGKVIATLVLAQTVSDEPWKNTFQTLYANTLGLITAISAAVELQLKLKRNYINLKRANETIEATLALIEDGIVTIDKNGTIIYSNAEARRIFKLMPDEVGEKNINDFLAEESSLLVLAQKGDSVTVEETIYLDQSEKQYIIHIQPIMDNDTGELGVAMLTLNHVGKLNALTTNRAGAVAKFAFNDIIGESEAIKRAITKGRYFAKSAENILLIGESGTGKELFAQAIHNHYCPNGPFIAINCAAMPRELIESELFGYEGGSFTGADRSGRPGKIELAEGGTLFLDEIGDMPYELQAVLLRVLEDKQVMRIGGRRYKKVDFRIIAATNQNLKQMVRDKLFRHDLYYRLSVLTIHIPALRERERDAEILANYFIKRCCRKMGKKALQMSPAASNIINDYEWPGNVRELENAMVYAAINVQGDVIETSDMPEEISGKGNFNQTVERIVSNDDDNKEGEFPSLSDIEKKAITKALSKSEGNVILAACLLGISKSTIYRKLKEYDIHY